MVQRLTNWLSRFFVVQDPGVASADSEEAAPGYPTESSTSAMSRFPWVYACVKARSGDIAGLPLVAVTVNSDGTRQINRAHPALERWKKPHERCSGLRLRRQLAADFRLTGNWYCWCPGGVASDGPILRIHPNQIKPVVRNGVVDHFVMGTTQKTRLEWDEVLHVGDISWEDGVTGVLGESPIRALNDDLHTELAAKNHSKASANRGRLEIILSAKEAVGGFNQETSDRIRDRYNESRAKGDGLFLVGEALEATPLSLTARDMEFSAQSDSTRFSTLAVMGVVPVRVGLPSANYGTSKQQMRNYWDDIRREAQLFNAEMSRTTGDGVLIEHDFADVEPLQVSYTERQLRAQTWMFSFGADPREAADFEGFPDAPVGEVSPAAPTATQRPAAEVDEGQERGLESAIWRYLQGASLRYVARVQSGDLEGGDEERTWCTAALMSHLPHARASALAGRIVAETDHAIRYLHNDARSTGVDGVIGLASLRAFGRERAHHIAREAA